MLRIFPAQDREELWNEDVTEETEHKWVKKKGTGAEGTRVGEGKNVCSDPGEHARHYKQQYNDTTIQRYNSTL